ncbi:MAG TPA: hypothetical protein VFG14_10140 [Chthoniobacteraceae bacterium]|nr:hypothetical protein [Chthoniobacteraceae bacterium]
MKYPSEDSAVDGTLRWSRTPPHSEGWYWVRRAGCRRRILRFLNSGAPWQHFLQPHRTISTTENWDWFAGPIPQPGKDENF